MKNNLKSYQRSGIEFLKNNQTSIPYHAILGDDMGLGKTAQSIVAAEEVNAQKILVICPSTVKINWQREIIKWSKYRNIFIAGKIGKVCAKDCIIDRNAEVVIVNYDLCIMPNIKRQLCSMKFDVCIVDEAHYLINKSSGRTKAILARDGIIWSAKYKWCLTGTFMKNRNRDCYAILRSLFPHVLGKYKEYRDYAKYFCGGRMGAFGFEDSFSTHTDELGRMIKPIMLRRTKADVLSELPDLMEQNIYLEHTPEIDRVINEESEFSPEDIAKLLNFEELGKTATYRKDLAMAKLPQVVSYVKDLLDTVNKITIFAYHRDFIAELQNKLLAYGVEVVVGGLSAEQKQYAVDTFVNDPNTRIFIGQIQAAGTGLDGLQLVCSEVVFAEIDWVPGTIDQARARCHRMGQKNKVHIHYLTVADSLEEKMINTLTRKRKDIASVMSEIEVKVEEDKKRKEKRPMSIEQSLERIATALEDLVAYQEEGGLRQACAAPTVEPTVEEEPKAEKPKKSKAKKQPTYTEEVATKVMESVVENVTPPAPMPTPTPVMEAVGVKAKTADELRVECIAAAEKLRNKVGAEATTVYINGITAQITGVPGSKLKDCDAEQLEAVLDAIESKVNENLEDLL